MNEKLTDKQISAMKSEADKIQPDVVKERDCEGLGEKDRANYDYMNNIYKQLCKRDSSFVLCFISPESFKPFIFYRLCEPDKQDKYQRVCGNLLGKIWNFLHWTGYVNFLEELGEIKLFKIPNRKTSKEEIDDIINEKSNS